MDILHSTRKNKTVNGWNDNKIVWTMEFKTIEGAKKFNLWLKRYIKIFGSIDNKKILIVSGIVNKTV